MRLGDAFLNLPDGTGYPSHLWFVISNPTLAGRVVIVNVSSDDDGYGDMPIMLRTEHSWLRYDSYIRTDFALLASLRELRAKLASGALEAKAPLTPTVLRRIQREVHASRHTHVEVGLVLYDQGLVGPTP